MSSQTGAGGEKGVKASVYPLGTLPSRLHAFTNPKAGIEVLLKSHL